mmetsp:Transcript_17320/g.38371  ORF Transcript_17320/g.38371 Transcript_17320/m.38371 type:complete len:211 (+) Transcript_17320:246-878(+)
MLHPGRWQQIHRRRELLVHGGRRARQGAHVQVRLRHAAILLGIRFTLGLFHRLELTVLSRILFGHVFHLHVFLGRRAPGLVLAALLCLLLGDIPIKVFFLFLLQLLQTDAFTLLLLLLCHLLQLDDFWQRLFTPYEDLRYALPVLCEARSQDPLILVDGHSTQSIRTQHVTGFPKGRLAAEEDPTRLHEEKVEGDLPTEGHRLRAVIPKV